jgi:hypothetical protein
VGWSTNTGDTGVEVNGDNVAAYGLFVEHYQKFNVVWSGENGRTVFFQNEMPYDPPNQAAWTHDGVLGFAAYKVADTVKQHEGWGLGAYCFFHVDPTIHASRAFEVPVSPGIKLHDLLTVSSAAWASSTTLSTMSAARRRAARRFRSMWSATRLSDLRRTGMRVGVGALYFGLSVIGTEPAAAARTAAGHPRFLSRRTSPGSSVPRLPGAVPGDKRNPGPRSMFQELRYAF